MFCFGFRACIGCKLRVICMRRPQFGLGFPALLFGLVSSSNSLESVPLVVTMVVMVTAECKAECKHPVVTVVVSTVVS